jgi:hypothetical protein
VAEALARIAQPFPDTRVIEELSTLARDMLFADFG